MKEIKERGPKFTPKTDVVAKLIADRPWCCVRKAVNKILKERDLQEKINRSNNKR